MELVGRAVRKTLAGFGTCTGVVDSYDPAARFFKILYDDGDSEEIEFAEINAILNAMGVSFSPPKNCSSGPGPPPPHFDPPPENDPRRLAEGSVVGRARIERSSNSLCWFVSLCEMGKHHY